MVADVAKPDPYYESQREAYKELSKESLSVLRRRVAQIRGSCKALLSSTKLTKMEEEFIRREADNFIYAYRDAKLLIEKSSSSVNTFMIAQMMSDILFSSINLAPYFPEIVQSVNRERNSRGGQARGEQLRNEVKERWQDDALKFFRARRDRNPEISQANLAKVFIEARADEDSYCPQEESVVSHIRDLEKSELLKRRVARKKTA